MDVLHVCVSMCTLWDVSGEDLSGTRNDVCSSAAELGHREVERREIENADRLNLQDRRVLQVHIILQNRHSLVLPGNFLCRVQTMSLHVSVCPFTA